MSLEALRSSALLSRHNAIREAQGAHLTLLHEFLRITNCIANNEHLSSLYNIKFPAPFENQSPEAILSWLRDNSLENSKHLDETTLPTPNILQDAASISVSEPNSPPSVPTAEVQAPSGAANPAGKATVALGPTSSQSMATPAVQHQPEPLRDASQNGDPSPAAAPIVPDGSSLPPPEQLAPPDREEEAQLSSTTERLLDLETPQKPAKVLHLPPEKVQEERLRERHQALRHEQSEQAQRLLQKPTPGQLSTHQEAASSPSSTNGAQSAATPQAPQESPGTSPDTEHPPEILPPKELRPSPEEQRVKDEHDRHLEAQKELARKAALGDVRETPDDQLLWEEREAAARDAEEREARESVNGPEAVASGEQEETQAEALLEPEAGEKMDGIAEAKDHQADAKQDALVDIPSTTPTNQNQGHETPSATAEDPKSAHKRTYSEMVEAVPSTPITVSPQNLVKDPTSASKARPVQDSFVDTSGVSSSPSGKPPQIPPHRRVPSDPYAAFENVDCLKGASEDPDRDYLEPLFKVQAYESQNIRSGLSLSELIRSASKSLSTQDQFTCQHERLDYRVLRRIYQLQNANKWSLRQMQQVKEPPQPVSHLDHMMAEMKWMRKDFRTEKKMKLNLCAFLANECAKFVAAGEDERKSMQVQLKSTKQTSRESGDAIPELDSSDSAPEDDAMPATPTRFEGIPATIVVAPDLSETVLQLRQKGQLGLALRSLPSAKPWNLPTRIKEPPRLMLPVSKFVDGKIRPLPGKAPRKRSRYDYEDDAKLLERESEQKRMCPDRDLTPEEQDIALFHPENKHIRDRLHASSLFRPPSEFQMPSTSFYEFRQGSHWLIEDEQKLRRLAKEYAFNWSLIAEEMTLPSRLKSSFDRRTPWECFEHWVELESLPQEMRKTAYFKTWYQRLEQSAAASERRFQAQVAAMQQASNGATTPTPMRRKTTPSRVDKRKNNRYLWLVDAMRKLARKREAAAYKQAEAQRAAASRKTMTDANQSNPPKLTPQQISQKRHERDLQQQEAFRQRQQALIDTRNRQAQMARAAAAQQHVMMNGMPGQQRPGVGMPQQHPQIQVNGQVPPPSRQPMPMATRNGHLAVPQVGAQGIPQAQMRPGGGMQPPNMQRMTYANGQVQNPQYGSQQQQMPNNGSAVSPGHGGMTAQHQFQSNQAMMNQYNTQAQQPNGAGQVHNAQNANNHQMGGSPNMPPPPAPHHQAGAPQQLSSGHVPAVIAIKNSLRASNPTWTEEQLQAATNARLQSQSQSQSQTQPQPQSQSQTQPQPQPHSQTTPQVRQNAMNAAAGINGGTPAQNNATNLQSYHQNQAAYHNNNNNNNTSNIPNGNAPFTNGDGINNTAQQAVVNGVQGSPQNNYAQLMRQRQMQQMRMHSPNVNGVGGGSPNLSHSSPNMQPASPNMQYANTNGMAQGVQPMNGNLNGQQRPPSRSNSGTPGQLQRIGSSGSVPGVAHTGGMQSPGALGQQGSPRTMQAGMAR
ncbi:hypothetical protein K431DRAFT_342892 [Polychaeton citri CBS 116435]|uniref:Vacuolar import and degradation protein 21 n=1 Tax=Polychaeton citri CBS 116435 TaxID=1314669 RepID=A0A9P4UU59_9PEZI|nr:hypothetical protein K431DRAFT_342892 [Polychaeton citri CBS 116435]